MGHPYPNKRQWLTALRADPAIPRTASALAEYVITQPAPAAGEYVCNQIKAARRLRVGLRTASRAMGELLASGYLERASKGAPHHAGRYRLAVPNTRQNGV